MTSTRILIQLSVVLSVVISISCARWNAMRAAQKEAEKFLEEFSVPNDRTATEWGMTEFRVFGRDRWAPFGIAAGSIALGECSASYDSCEVMIPLWCKGRDLKGRNVKLKRELQLSVQLMDDAAKAQVVSHHFTNDRALTFFRQAMSWAAWSFLGPLLIFALLLTYSGGSIFFDSTAFRLLVGISGVIAIALSGYSAYVCFGSAAAVLVCQLTYWSVIGISSLAIAVRRVRKARLQ